MKTMIAIYFRWNPQLQNGGYYKLKVVKGKSTETIENRLYRLADRSVYGSFTFERLVEVEKLANIGRTIENCEFVTLHQEDIDKLVS